jgi:hypothetical protein
VHFYLERLERIIQDTRGMSCVRLGDEALEITDRVFNDEMIVVAEMVEPFSIRLGVRTTSSLQDTTDRSKVEIYEFLMQIATNEAVALIWNEQHQVVGISVKFPCDSTITQMAVSFQNAYAELFSFFGKHTDNIRMTLIRNNVKPE